MKKNLNLNFILITLLAQLILWISNHMKILKILIIENGKKKSFEGDIVKIVKSKTIDEILEISKPHTKIDFLNIDIEGMDFTVLKQLVPKKINPKLISIETHSTENTKLRDCDQIYDFLKNSNYVVLDRAGQSTLFKLND